MPTPLLVYEDNALLRESLCSLISSHARYRVAAAFEHVWEVVAQIRQYRPELVLMDVDMPGLSGIEAVKRIRKTGADLPIIMLTVFEDHTHVFEALKAGASGYLLKKHLPARLFDALDDVLNGGAPMSPGIARMVIQSMQSPAQQAYALTTREKEILQSLSQGNSYKMMAAQLDISIDTVRTHIKKIYEKLQVHSQTEAVSKALREKLV